MKQLFALLLSLLMPVLLIGQIDTWWDLFCNRQLDLNNPDAIYRYATNSTDPEDRARALLMTASGTFYHNRWDSDMPIRVKDLLRQIQDDVLAKQKGAVKSRITSDPCFNDRFRELLDSLRSDVRRLARAAIDAEMKRQTEVLLQEIIRIQAMVPTYLQPCANVTFQVSDNLMDVEFTINLIDCHAEIDRSGLNPGEVGWPHIYECISDWYLDSVLRSLGRDPEKEWANTTLEITGKSDSLPVNGNLHMSHSLVLPAGKEYTYMGPDNEPVPAQVPYTMDRMIPYSTNSNRFLALARACLAEIGLSKMAGHISIVAREYDKAGGNYRGVTIKISARGVLEALAYQKLQEAKNGNSSINKDLDKLEQDLKTNTKSPR